MAANANRQHMIPMNLPPDVMPVMAVFKNGCFNFVEVIGQAEDEDFQAHPRCSTLPARLPKDEPAFQQPQEEHLLDSDDEEAEDCDSTRAVVADTISNSLSTSSASARQPEGLPLEKVKRRWASMGSCLGASDEDSPDALEQSDIVSVGRACQPTSHDASALRKQTQQNGQHTPTRNADYDSSAPSRSRHSSMSSFEQPPSSSGSGTIGIEAGGSSSGSTSRPSLPMAQPGAESGGAGRPAAVGPITHAKNSRKKLWCHFYLDEEMLHAQGFNLNKKIIGTGGEHTKSINIETDAKVRLRGKGSGHGEKNGREADVPLMVAVTLEARSGEEKFCKAIRLAIEHLLKVQRQYKSFLQREGCPTSADDQHIRIGGMCQDAEFLLREEQKVQELRSVAPFGHHGGTATAANSNMVAQTSRPSSEMPASQPRAPRRPRNRQRNGAQAAEWWR